MHSAPRLAAVAALALLTLGGCGVRVGYRSAYHGTRESGLYGGPWIQLATSTAAEADYVGSSPYWVLHADYAFARGDDFATIGTGLAIAPDADGWHNAITLQVGWEPWHGAGLHVSLCEGYGNWGVLQACGRWSSKGYWGVDLGGGLNPTRLGADMHEACRDGCSGGGFDYDD